MSKNNSNAMGFTLIELIIVIVVLGILAVTAVPRFMASDPSTEMATVEARLMGLLRLQQQRAMQDTANFGYGVSMGANKVTTLPVEAERDINLDAVAVSGLNTGLYFNSKGCPVPSGGGVCGVAAREITITAGSLTRNICVQSQGYIRLGSC
ncbi:type II secretion system protein [Aliidiomarina quisquiliarum]|uniref:pilus assembly FimT family protein n=1 Tax=Aliidiomarina quisquiliarum TaxID=2938947 RepID=UPI0030846ECD